MLEIMLIILTKTNGFYEADSYNDVPLWLLSSILFDVGCKPLFFIEALKESWEELGTNVRYLIRKGDRVIVGDCIALKQGEKYEFELEINHLIEILEKWGELCQQGVDEIIMKRTGDQVVLEGK